MTIYTKRPQDSLTVTFDLRGFVARMVSEGVSPESIAFSVRQAPGVDVASTMAVRGLVVCVVSGGELGKFYHLGVDATAPDGDSQSEVSRIRVRDASQYDALPTESEVTFGSTVVYLTTPSGLRLTTLAGEYLTF